MPEVVIKWLESHGYRILSLDHITWCIYHGKFNLNHVGDDIWYKTVADCLENGIIEEVACNGL